MKKSGEINNVASAENDEARETIEVDAVRSQRSISEPNDASVTPPSEKLWTRDFFVITLVNFLLFCGFQFFPSSLPLYVKELGASDMVLGWVTGITTIASIMMRPFSGIIVDRFGRKGILLFSMILLIGISVSFTCFPIVGVVLALRFVYGLGWGLANTSGNTIASDVIPPKRFGEGMGFFSLSTNLAMAIAPGIAISLFHSMGMPFVSYLAAGVLACAFLLAIFVHSKPIERPTKELEEKTPWHEKMFEKHAIFPAVIVAFVTGSYGAVITFLAVYAAEQGVDNIGVFFTVYAIALLITRPAVGRIVDTYGAHSVVLPGFCLLTASLLILSFSDSLILFLISATILGIGFGCTQSGLQTMAIAQAPPYRRGAANATFFVGFDLGIGLGSILSGPIAGFLGYAGMYAVYAFLPMLAAALLIAHLRKDNKKPIGQ